MKVTIQAPRIIHSGARGASYGALSGMHKPEQFYGRGVALDPTLFWTPIAIDDSEKQEKPKEPTK